jgi:hypothetical protein
MRKSSRLSRPSPRSCDHLAWKPFLGRRRRSGGRVLAQTSYWKTYSHLVAVCWPKLLIRKLIQISMLVFEFSNSNYLLGLSYEARRCGSSSPKWRMLCRHPPYDSAGAPAGDYLGGADGDALSASTVKCPLDDRLLSIPSNGYNRWVATTHCRKSTLIYIDKTICMCGSRGDRIYHRTPPRRFVQAMRIFLYC